jgi:apolipoprotein N-acyltransferase
LAAFEAGGAILRGVRTTLRGIAAGAISGLLGALAFPSPGITLLAFVCLVPLFLHLRAREGSGPGWPFFSFGLCYFTVGLWWLATILTPAGPVLLALILTLLFAWPAGHLLGLLLRHRVPAAPATVLVWVGFDWLRGWLFTGFPWLYLAHSQAEHTSLVQAADLFGAHGVTAVIVLVNAGIVETVRRAAARRGGRAAAALLPAAVAVGALLCYGAMRAPSIREREGPRILLVQGNVPQFMKEDAWRVAPDTPRTADDILARHLALTREGIAKDPAVELVVWPETTFPYRTTDEPGPERDAWRRLCARRLAAVAAAAGRPVVFGSLHRTAAGEPRNSAWLMSSDGRLLTRYDKVHLVPGGEYIPLSKVAPEPLVTVVARLIRESAGFVPDLTEGSGTALFRAAGLVLGPVVCYEVAYPGLARDAVRAGADAILNLTNYGWWPGTSMPAQATQMAIFRAIENRRPVVVAANTGVTGIIDARGVLRVAVSVEGRRTDVRGTVSAAVPLCGSRSAWTLLGDLPAGLCLVGALLWLPARWLAALRRRRLALFRLDTPEGSSNNGRSS